MEQPVSRFGLGVEEKQDNPDQPEFENSFTTCDLPPSMRVNSLRKAMASADLRLALEGLSDEDEPLQPGSAEADRFARSLESELESSVRAEDDAEESRFDQKRIDRVNMDLRKACGEIAREAQLNLRINQLVRERDRELRSLKTRTTEPLGEEEEVEPERESAFMSAISRRRMLVFSVAAALAGAASVVLGLAAFGERWATAPGKAVAGIEDAGPQSPGESAAAGAGPDGMSVIAAVAAPRIARADMFTNDWQRNLTDRLGADSPSDDGAGKTAEMQAAVSDSARHEAAGPEPEANSVKLVEPASEPAAVESGKEMARLSATGTGSAEPTPALAEISDTPADNTVEPAATEAVVDSEPSRTERTPDMVTAALASARGLDDLKSTQRDTLRNLLVEGECLSSALGSVFVKVPVLAMRDLVLKLESEC